MRKLEHTLRIFWRSYPRMSSHFVTLSFARNRRDANSVTIGICIVGRIMAKPVLLIVDDDSDVLRAIERDLRFKYGADYRVIGSGAPEEALDLLKQLKVRNDSVALLLADQRMPQKDGVTFLRDGMEIFPDAKR